MPISVALATLGCKVNQAESEELRRQLEAIGCVVTDTAEEAQVYVINTCTVTHVADRKSRNLVQRACRANPRAHVLVTGCYAQRAPRELANSPQVRFVPKQDAESLAHYLSGMELTSFPAACPPSISPRRARSTVKAQDGCDQRCTFCAVPLARGRSRSLPVAGVLRRVRESIDAGYREIVLTGVNLTYYADESGLTLGGLLDRVLEAGPDRLRLSSLQPQAIEDGLLRRWQDHRLCPHFHLALQSGSDSVLRRMGRRYTAAQYQEAIAKIREAVPRAAITTDVMVGFPGETDAEFAETYELCREIGFARTHVFQYSARPGTAAARLPGAVPARVKSARCQKMLALAAESARAFREPFLGATEEVLFEEETTALSNPDRRGFPAPRAGPGKGRQSPNSVLGFRWWRGYSANYLEVRTQSRTPLDGLIRPVRLNSLLDDILIGTVDDGTEDRF